MGRPPLTPEQRSVSDQRARAAIVGGLTTCIVERGYAATSIADIASASKVSKTTVYAHFDDKEDIFVALFGMVTDASIKTVRFATDSAREQALPWRRRLRVGVDIYVRSLLANLPLAHCMIIEAPAVSARIRQRRRQSIEQLSAMLRDLAEQVCADEGLQSHLTPALLMAAVGGTSELLRQALESPIPDCDALVDDVTELIAHIFLASDPARR